MIHVGGMDEETQALVEHWRERCTAKGLTEDQTEQVVDFRTDPWWCNADSQADVVVDFFKRQNEQMLEDPDFGDPAYNAHPQALR